MTSRIKPEIRKIGQRRFPRWVIVDDRTKSPGEQKFWNGKLWVAELRDARLFAYKDEAMDEVITIHLKK